MAHGANDSGYFDDGTKIGFDGTAHVSMGHTNEPLVHAAWNRTSVIVYQQGHNLNRMVVHGAVQRHNQGDGEWYLYQKLLDLSASGLGDLIIGGPTWIKYPNCLWVSGEGKVTCGTDDGSTAAYVEYRHEFIQSAGEKTEDLSRFQTGATVIIDFSTWAGGMPVFYTQYNEDPEDMEGWKDGMPFSPIAEQSSAFTLPSEPAEYSGRNNNRTYTFDGTALGLASGEGLTIRCSREPQVQRAPRCYGVRVIDRAQRRSMRIEVPVCVDVHTYPTRWQFEEWLHEQSNNWGDAPASLAGNGNTFTDCHLRGCDLPGGGQWDHLRPDAIQFTFEKELT
ncbi:MAG: hypothetical protein GXP25_04885 [Planctomycetes bacterium]|nr:hypothetical protein [Planctomycetota bacterium]